MSLKFITPKKFVCYYSLDKGTKFVGTFMACLALITGVTILFHVMSIHNTSCDKFVLRTAYGFGVSTIVHNVIMFFIDIWLLWGVETKKTTVVLVWVVITSAWLVQVFLLLVVLLYMHELEISTTAGTISLALGLIAVVVLVYFILVVFGFWVDLKRHKVVMFASSTKTT